MSGGPWGRGQRTSGPPREAAYTRRCGEWTHHSLRLALDRHYRRARFDRHRDAAASNAAEFLVHDHRVGVIEAHSAIRLGLVHAEEPELREEFVRRKRPVPLPRLDGQVEVAAPAAV